MGIKGYCANGYHQNAYKRKPKYDNSYPSKRIVCIYHIDFFKEHFIVSWIKVNIFEEVDVLLSTNFEHSMVELCPIPIDATPMFSPTLKFV